MAELSSSHSACCAASKTIIRLAPAENFALVADHKRIEIRLEFGKGGAQHEEDIVAERIHFAVEFAAEDAIAQIDQRGS